MYNTIIVMLLLLSLSVGNKITAKEFNLDSYKSWPLDLNLTFMEKKALLSLLGKLFCDTVRAFCLFM